MTSIDFEVKKIYLQPPRTRAFSQDRMDELNSHRIIAAHKNEALEYKLLCDATGIDPEPQFIHLYQKGIEDYKNKKFTEKIKQLEYHIDKALYGHQKFAPEKKIHEPKQLTEMQLKFLKEAEQYDKNPFNQQEGKKLLLQKYHETFRPKGKKNLNKLVANSPEDKTKIGRLFNHIYESYFKRNEICEKYFRE